MSDRICDCGHTPIIRNSIDAQGSTHHWVRCMKCKKAQKSRHDSPREAWIAYDGGDKGKVHLKNQWK